MKLLLATPQGGVIDPMTAKIGASHRTFQRSRATCFTSHDFWEMKLEALKFEGSQVRGLSDKCHTSYRCRAGHRSPASDK